MCQRLKIMSDMNIADKLSPQDGRFYLNIGGREADFRVSCLPTVHGENIVLRVLDKSASIVPLTKLGFSEHNQKLIKKSQSRPEGIIIVTGPTGSGKTTTSRPRGPHVQAETPVLRRQLLSAMFICAMILRRWHMPFSLRGGRCG